MKTVLILFLFLFMTTIVAAQGFQGEVAPQNSNGTLESLNFLFDIFGIPAVSFIGICTAVFFIVTALQRKLPKSWTGGKKTDIIALIVAFLLSLKVFYPAILTIIVCTLLAWLIPAGTYTLLKDKLGVIKEKNNGSN